IHRAPFVALPDRSNAGRPIPGTERIRRRLVPGPGVCVPFVSSVTRTAGAGLHPCLVHPPPPVLDRATFAYVCWPRPMLSWIRATICSTVGSLGRDMFLNV